MDKKILDKIKKCLRLAKSSNANEAATALRQAQKLMESYGISSDEVAASDVESYSTKSGAGNTPPNHIATLIDMVCTAFGSSAVYSKQINPKNFKYINVVEFIGVGSSAQITGYAYEVLLRQLKRDRSEFLKTLRKQLKQSTKVRRADMYCEGWVLAVSEKISNHKRTEQELNAVEKYKEKRWAKGLNTLDTINRADKAKNNDMSSFSNGMLDGEKVDFHSGVNGTKRKAITND